MEYVCDAVIVMGEALNDDGSMKSILEERVIKAAELYDAGSTKKLIMSGGDPHNNIGITEAEMMREYALLYGVSDAHILEDRFALDSAGNILFPKITIFLPECWSVVGILTSDYKIPRSEPMARHIFGPTYILRGFGVDHNLDPEVREQRVQAELKLTNSPFHDDLDRAEPGNDNESLKIMFTRSGNYADRPEYNFIREELGLPPVIPNRY